MQEPNELRPQDASTAGSLDRLLGLGREELGLDDDGLLGQMATAEQFVVAELDQVNDGHLAAGLVLDATLTGLVSDQRPQLVQVHGGAELVVLTHVEHSHTDLSEVSGMVFVHVDAVVVHATSVTATSGMLAVLAWREKAED